MATQYFVVTRDQNAAVLRKNGIDFCVVVAEDSTEALAMAASYQDGDSNGAWEGATATALAAAANLNGFVLRVQLFHVTTGVRVEDVSVVGVSGATIDSIAALMVTALNATATIANAAYNSSTQVLTVAAGGSDAIGDWTFDIQLLPPAATYGSPQNLTGWFSSHTDGGTGSDDLKVTLGADARTKPIVFIGGKQP